MVCGSRKSRTYRRIHKKVTTKTKLVYELRKPAKAVCGNCGTLLSGVPRERPSRLARIPKTSRRPERPFGGVLCTKCMRDYMIFEARESQKIQEE